MSNGQRPLQLREDCLTLPEARDRLLTELRPPPDEVGAGWSSLWPETICRILAAALASGRIEAFYEAQGDAPRSTVPASAWAWRDDLIFQFAPLESLSEGARRAVPISIGGVRPVLSETEFEVWRQQALALTPITIWNFAHEVASVNEGLSAGAVLDRVYREIWSGSFERLSPIDELKDLPNGLSVAIGGWMKIDPDDILLGWKLSDSGESAIGINGWQKARLTEAVRTAQLGDNLYELQVNFHSGALTIQTAEAICSARGWNAPAIIPPSMPAKRFAREIPVPVPADRMSYWRETIAEVVVDTALQLGMRGGVARLWPYCKALAKQKKGFDRRSFDKANRRGARHGPLFALVDPLGWNDELRGRGEKFDHLRFCDALGLEPDDPLLGTAGMPRQGGAPPSPE